MGEIVSIVYKPQQSQGRPKPFERTPLEHASLIAGYGIEGDRKGGNPRRQLNLMSYETIESLKAEGFKINPGELGEQIVIKGLVVEHMAPGDRIQLGESAIVEVISLREPCERFEAAQDKPLEEAVGRVGVMARVVQSGAVRVGDPVQAVAAAVQRAPAHRASAR